MKKIFFIVITFFIFVSCKKDETEPIAFTNPIEEPVAEECTQYRIAYVTTVDAPNSATVNTLVQIDVSHHLINGCWESSRFIESANGNIKTIEVETKYVGCTCITQDFIHTKQYEFFATTAGIYTLKFKSGPADYIEVNLEINE